MPPLAGLVGGSNVSVGGALDSLNRLLKFSGWPPYYESICGNGACANIPRGGHTLKVGAEFELSRFENGEGLLKNVVLTRTSTLRGNARKAFPKPPSVECYAPPTPF